jgi:hypothetical protein
VEDITHRKYTIVEEQVIRQAAFAFRLKLFITFHEIYLDLETIELLK